MGFELAGEAVAEEVFAGEVAGEAVAASTAYTAADAAALGAMTEGAAVAGGALAGGALLRVGVQLGLSFLVSKLFSPKLNRAETSQGTLVNSLTTVDPIPVIYGTRRVGATVCPVGVSGPSQEFLHLICVWGEGPVSAIGIVYLDGVATTDGKFAGLVTREDFLGTDGQAASGTLVAAMADASKWNASCTLAGIAYTYLILKWDQTVFARGRPLITADVNGRTLFDPRTSTTGFSRNPALALRDYLTNSRYGRGYGSGAIDDATFAEATYHCDDLVARPGGATQARYVCDGVVNPDDAPLDIVKGLLLACRGNLIYSGGKYKLKIDRGFVLSESNILGAWSWQQPGRRTRFNAVKARFYDPATNYLPNITVWPPAGGAQSVAYLAQDNGLVLASQLELPFTTNLYTAQQICQVEAKKSRNPLLVSLNATIAAMALEVGDIVPVAHATPGWPAVGDPAEGKLFRVEEVELLASDEVRLGLRLYDAAAYSLDALTLQPSLTLTSLPDASIVAVPLNVAASSGTNQLFIAGDGTVVSRLLVTWDVSTNAFVTSGGRVIVQFKRQSDAAWQNFTSLDGSATQAYLTPVDDGITYDVRVAFENQMQARSSWVQISHTVIGKTAAPSDVTGFQVNGTRLSWNPVTDSDLWGYRVRFQAGSSQSWGDAVWLHGQGAAQQDVLTTPPFTIPAGIGVGQATLMMKAVDLSGNESQNPAILVVNLSGASVANVVQTFDRKSAGFPGTQTNCAVDGSGNLAANSTTLMWSSDDRASMWKADSTSLMWAVAAFAQLQYEDRIVTTGSRAGSTLTLSAAVSGDPWRIEYRENSTKAMWGADASALMWNASASTLMWDAPAYLTWPGQVSVFPDSMFDLRITAGQAQTQGKITGLTVTLDAPDISETLANVAISSGGTRLAPLRSYGTVKSVQLTVVTDGGAAVSATQEDTQATGPLIKARDGSGVAVNGHVNARIEGY
jgi:hypothetical protein